MLINATFFHVLPVIVFRGRFSPGMLTAIVLFYPTGDLGFRLRVTCRRAGRCDDRRRIRHGGCSHCISDCPSEAEEAAVLSAAVTATRVQTIVHQRKSRVDTLISGSRCCSSPFGSEESATTFCPDRSLSRLPILALSPRPCRISNPSSRLLTDRSRLDRSMKCSAIRWVTPPSC
jgi:hypothetical protein